MDPQSCSGSKTANIPVKHQRKVISILTVLIAFGEQWVPSMRQA